MARSNDHTFEGVLRKLRSDVDLLLRRRNSASFPTRLGPVGQLIPDWNLAVEPGFYWGDGTEANGPTTYPGVSSTTGWVSVLTASDGTSIGVRQYAQRALSNVLETRYRNSSGVWGAWHMVGAVPGQEVGDCNLAVLPGFYRTVNAANQPTTTSFGSLVVRSGGDGTRLRQEFERVYTESGVRDLRRWTRDSIDGGATWNTWTVIDLRDTDWVALTPAAGWSQSQLRYRRKNGMFEMMGEIWGGTDGSVCFTLPMTPNTRSAWTVGRISSSAYKGGVVSIQADGVASFRSQDGSVQSTSPGYSMAPIAFLTTD